LADVYVPLIRPRRAMLQFEPITLSPSITPTIAKDRPQLLPPRVSAADLAEHRSFVHTLGSTVIWRDYFTSIISETGQPPAASCPAGP
jgi:hypothetical protein